jgi:hypothetical protein
VGRGTNDIFELSGEAILARRRRQEETKPTQPQASLINNGVDHVDDPQSGLPVLLLGSSGGDAQAAFPRHCLIFRERASTMLAEKFFLYLEALIKSQQTHSDGAPRVISSSPHVPVSLPAAK